MYRFKIKLCKIVCKFLGFMALRAKKCIKKRGMACCMGKTYGFVVWVKQMGLLEG